MGAALLALTGALAAACFVKAFGVTFLGHWRGHHNPNVHEVGWPMRIGMMLAALTCLGLGVLPTLFIEWMDVISEQLVGRQDCNLSNRDSGGCGLLPLHTKGHLTQAR